jgi:glycogen debranching enzyme
LGPWLRAGKDQRGAAAAARASFIAPSLTHLETASLGHVTEIADGDPPHTPRGCPFQAWPMGKRIRLQGILRSLEL